MAYNNISELVCVANTLSTHQGQALTCKHVTNLILLKNTWCDYEVPGMILLRDLMGVMQLDCSKGMSVHVSICINHDFNALKHATWKLWC
jgi:hypothetical protein